MIIGVEAGFGTGDGYGELHAADVQGFEDQFLPSLERGDFQAPAWVVGVLRVEEGGGAAVAGRFDGPGFLCGL